MAHTIELSDAEYTKLQEFEKITMGSNEGIRDGQAIHLALDLLDSSHRGIDL